MEAGEELFAPELVMRGATAAVRTEQNGTS